MARKIADFAPPSLADLGTFLDADQKQAIAGLPLRLLSITDDPGNRYGPRWIVSVADPDSGEKYALGFAHNVYRDRVMRSLADAIEAGEEFDAITVEKVTPEKGGNAFWTIRDAGESDAAEPVEAVEPVTLAKAGKGK